MIFELMYLLAAFLGMALLASIFNPPGFFVWLRGWIREEVRLLRAESWGDGVYAGTAADPAVQRMAKRQAELADRMRNEGRHLLAGRHYVPVLTKPTEARPPMADKVVPIRKRAGAKR